MDYDRDQLYLHLEAELGFGIDRLPGGRARQGSLRDVEARAEACTACPLHAERDKLVFGAGDPKARLLFVGEAPGVDEDRTGVPFVGRAGQLLTRMIEAMGYVRDAVYIANVIKCHPKGNRTPSPRETEACRSFLEAQIRIIAPEVIVALGAPAARTLLRREQGIGALRGRAYAYEGNREIVIIPTFHPAYLLRNEAEKGKAWQDLQLAMERLR
jgi:DNA polymerase